MFLDQQTRSLSLETTTQDIVTAIEEDAIEITTAGTTDPLSSSSTKENTGETESETYLATETITASMLNKTTTYRITITFPCIFKPRPHLKAIKMNHHHPLSHPHQPQKKPPHQHL